MTSLFLLSRSTITIPLIVALMAYLACYEVRLRATALPFVLITLISVGMMAYSIKDTSSLVEELFVRVVDGQWLGLPLYLWYFQQDRQSLTSVMHPFVRDLFGLAQEDTPGRVLMRFVLPAAAESGGAGVIPTYFIGEAYALGGWLFVAFSVLYVALLIYITAFSFRSLPKTIVTCLLYGLSCYKIGNGIVSGISAFMVSGTTILILFCFLWSVHYSFMTRKKII
jgi:hypothetical protein